MFRYPVVGLERGNQRLLNALLSVALVLSITCTAQASFEELPTGARASGMANAFTAIADDAYSMYYNPAGLVQIRRPEVTAYYAKLYSGLTDNSTIARSFTAYAHPLRTHGAIGISYLTLNLGDLYSESTIGLTYAHAVVDRWNVGGSLKFLKKSFGSDAYTQNAINDAGFSSGQADPLFAQNGTSKSGMAIDVGTQYRLTKIYGLGFTILNLNSPNMALSTGDTDKVSSVYKFGFARRTVQSAADIEVSSRKFTTDEFRLNMGGERWFQSGIGLRAGLGFGQRQYQVTSLGFSYRLDNLELAYGLIYPLVGIKGTFGTHQLSLTFRVGKKD